MNAKTESQTISLSYDLPYAPAKVWRALTEPELVGSWLMSNDLKPVVGHQFKFRSQPMPWWDGIVNCEVLEVEPEKRLAYTWRSGPDTSPMDTVVTWTLTPTSTGGTQLALEHSGFTPSDQQALEGATKGWKRMLSEKIGEVLSKLA